MRTLFLSLLLSLYLSLFLHAGAADVRGQSVDITNWQPVRDMSNWPFSKSVYSQLRRCSLEGPKDRLASFLYGRAAGVQTVSVCDVHSRCELTPEGHWVQGVQSAAPDMLASGP